MAATGICELLSTVRSETRVEDISGQQDACATELVRHTLQIWFRSWKQKYPKCKREGAVGVDGKHDEFNERRRENFQRDWRET